MSTCYLAAADPNLKEGLHLAKQTSYKQVFVLPYLLFTGILMNEIKEELEQLSTDDQQFILANYLGYHDGLAHILSHQVKRYYRAEEINTMYTVMLDLKDRSVLVVGGGTIATRRIKGFYKKEQPLQWLLQLFQLK